MRRGVALLVVILFLVSFIAADLLTGSTVDNNTGMAKSQGNSNSAVSAANTNATVKAITAKGTVLSESQIRNALQARNRLRIENKTGVQCPAACTCSGGVMKCSLANGREMTVVAGKSGNVIVQVKGENMTTNVTLYKSQDGKIYGVFRNNETKIVRMLPDQVKERIRERLRIRLENENITLNEDGIYEYRAQKKARLFLIFPVRAEVRADIDAETGELIRVNKAKWWEGLARYEKEETLGTSCGTVTTGENDNCCKNKGYDMWDAEKEECAFSE